MRLCWSVSSLLGVFLFATAAEAAKLEYWRFNANQSRLDLITDQGVRPQAVLIPDPTRLVIDLPGTTLGQQTTHKNIGKWVREVRVGQLNRQTTRLVIELNSQYTFRPQEVRVRGITPNRWFIQLPKLQPRSQFPGSQRFITIPVPPLKPPTVATPIRRVMIVVDPGHGGPDVGAVGRGGLLEKHVVFAIASEVYRLLNQRGVKAVLTRTQDRDLDLAPRVAYAEGLRADAFVSIHANSINLSRPAINGLETYHAPGSSSGARLARTIHNSILGSISVRDRGVRQARFYVLRKTSMPAVLVEVGFVTGREDAAKLADPNYRSKMAAAITQGVLQYFQLK
ncbi:MAG TPA: N-acetylmuramoyl-L-alanine amidase [Candidatus Caenarcaniphilales bacterium]